MLLFSFIGNYSNSSKKVFYNSWQENFKNIHSHVVRLWYFSSCMNSFFKRACAAIQWGWMSDFWLDLLYFMCANSEGSGETA